MMKSGTTNDIANNQRTKKATLYRIPPLTLLLLDFEVNGDSAMTLYWYVSSSKSTTGEKEMAIDANKTSLYLESLSARCIGEDFEERRAESR
jgi:hypothetical protein